MPCVGFLHDDDAGVVPELPGELSPANVHGKNLRRAVLQQTIGEPARGRTQVECRQSGDIQLKMAQGVFQFVAAAADVFLVRVQGEPVIGFDGVARRKFARRRLARFADLVWDSDGVSAEDFARYLERARGLGFVGQYSQ